jgi:hypothetical protein
VRARTGPEWNGRLSILVVAGAGWPVDHKGVTAPHALQALHANALMISATHRGAVAAAMGAHGTPIDVALVLVRWRKVGPFNLTLHTSRRARSQRSYRNGDLRARPFPLASKACAPMDGRLGQRLRANIAGAAEIRRSTVGGDRPRASPLLRAVGLLHKRRVSAAPSSASASRERSMRTHSELSACVGTGPAAPLVASAWQ